MQYVMMSIEEASKLAKKNAIVLVSTRDLESEDCNYEFTKKEFHECRKLIEGAETIARECDDFLNQLLLFTNKQIDIINYEPRGKLSVILLKS